ncbi:MAG: type II secretion system protein [Phycisphaerae bacterium]
MHCCNREKTSGFTMIEAMLATMVLAIAAAGILVPFVTGASLRAEGQRKTLAAILAADLMEQIIREPNNSKWENYNEPQGQIKKNVNEADIFTDPVYSQYIRSATREEAVSQEKGYYNPYEGDEPIFWHVEVSVYYQGREMASISRLITK